MSDKELRELDYWIGENVFGFQITRIPIVPAKLKTSSICDDVAAAEFRKAYPNARATTVDHYSTDPAAAMMVLEKCISKLGWYRIVNIGTTSQGNFFINHCDPEPDSEAFCDVDAATLPLAICLFAKKLFTK